jgi:uncharacterized iron-regulated membrane protein
MGIAIVLLVIFALYMWCGARRHAPKALAQVEGEHEYQWDEHAACIARQSNPHN